MYNKQRRTKVSNVNKHGAVMLTDEGERMKSECYFHFHEPQETVEGGVEQ